VLQSRHLAPYRGEVANGEGANDIAIKRRTKPYTTLQRHNPSLNANAGTLRKDTATQLASMAPAFRIVNTGAVKTMGDEVRHIETARPLKKHKFAKTKNFTAKELMSLATSPLNHDLLQASPYSDEAHLLDLTTLAKALQLFAEALTGMRWITRDFATTPYHKAFNWDSIADIFSRTMRAEHPDETLESLHLYVIVFRSKINEHADRQLLGELDKAAHIEAIEGGGLLKYWFGTPNEVGRNLATCKYWFVPGQCSETRSNLLVIGVWRNRADARRGGAGPGHAQAMRAAARMYDEWFVERLKLTVNPNVGSWNFSAWVDDEEAG
jgi:hypothetical protein